MCNCCQTEVSGHVVKCAECPDFDLCLQVWRHGVCLSLLTFGFWQLLLSFICLPYALACSFYFIISVFLVWGRSWQPQKRSCISIYSKLLEFSHIRVGFPKEWMCLFIDFNNNNVFVGQKANGEGYLRKWNFLLHIEKRCCCCCCYQPFGRSISLVGKLFGTSFMVKTLRYII